MMMMMMMVVFLDKQASSTGHWCIDIDKERKKHPEDIRY